MVRSSTSSRLLRREREQNKDVDPDRGHRVPVPGRDVDDDAAGFDVQAIEPGSDIGKE